MKPRAFTLVELLVVISVIAVLMGILMPVLSKARAAGQNAKCKGNLKGYALAVSMYTTDNDGRFQEPWFAYFSQRGPYPSETGIGNQYIHLRWCNGDLYLREHPEIAGPFYRYLSDARGFICPRFKVLTRFGQACSVLDPEGHRPRWCPLAEWAARTRGSDLRQNCSPGSAGRSRSRRQALLPVWQTC